MLEVRDMPPERRRSKRRKEWWIVGGVLTVLAGVLAFAAWDIVDTPADGPQPVAKPQAASGPETQVKPAVVVDDLVDDDGKTLWASPTQGPPLNFTFLPPESEIVLALRPAELLAHSEGPKVFAAVGPLAKQAVAEVARTTSLSLPEIEQLVVSWRMIPNHGWAYSQLVHVRGDVSKDGIRARLERHIPRSYNDRTFVFIEDRVYFRWGESEKLVEDSWEIFAELFPPEPVIPRDLERLVRHTDALRQVTLIARPAFLLSDQHDLFSGPMLPLRQPLAEILGPEVASAAISMNWDDNFFLELVAVPTLDSSPSKVSDELARRVDDLSQQVEELVLELQASPYGRRVVARLPEMVRRLAAYTRHGFDRDAAILRCYLPVQAGHNLVIGAELALAEAQADGGERAGVRPVAEATSPLSIVERLQKRTSLRFEREELEAALDILAQDLGVAIVIRGPDLQADGITRNQLFAVDMTDRTGAEILVEILRRANPDKLAAGPADPRQKLVYVVSPDVIVITTRSQAAARHEVLPAAFRAE